MTADELQALYGAPAPAALAKETDHVTADYRALIEASPFAVLATCGTAGLDCSPRGDKPGFVRVQDPGTILMPDRRGNNRIDSLRNILHDPRVALLFMIPGRDETLRLMGRAEILLDAELTASFSVDGKAPRSVIRVDVERVLFQCARAIVRSNLWNPADYAAFSRLPTTGEILANLTLGSQGGEEYDRRLQARLKHELY